MRRSAAVVIRFSPCLSCVAGRAYFCGTSDKMWWEFCTCDDKVHAGFILEERANGMCLRRLGIWERGAE